LIAVLNEAGQSSPKELLDIAKSIPGKGNQRMTRYGRPDQYNRPMHQFNNGMRAMGGQGGWMNGGGNQMGYQNSNNAFNRDKFNRPDQSRPFNKYNANPGSDEGKIDGGYKKPDINNRFKNPMQNGFVANQQAPQQNGGYQKTFTGQEGGFKPRNSFVKPDFNGNPRNNQHFGGDKPPFQGNYMGNKPRAPFNNNGAAPRFGNSGGEYAGGTQKYNKFENYKGTYGGEKTEGGSDVFQGVKSFSSSGNRHYNSGNRFNDHQNQALDGQSGAVHAQQPPPQQFVTADAIDGAQPFDSNMIAGYRMVANGQIPPFPPAFGE
jgi:hypothetical protein